jgi:PTS system cellobiose-specific IIB component
VETVTADSVPVEIIPMLDYGRMNGPAVLALALKMKNNA